MPTAISSWRELMYNGTPSLCAFALAKASHTGDHSDPGEAKILSSPICESTRNRVSAPVRPSVSIMTISFFLRVPIVPDVPIVSRKSRTLYQITARYCNSLLYSSFPLAGEEGKDEGADKLAPSSLSSLVWERRQKESLRSDARRWLASLTYAN